MKLEKCYIQIRKNFFFIFTIGFIIGFYMSRVFCSTSQQYSNSILILPNYIDQHDKSNKITVDNFSNKKTLIQEEDILCKVPTLDPWDPEIAAKIEHPTGIECDQVQPYLTILDYDGVLG